MRQLSELSCHVLISDTPILVLRVLPSKRDSNLDGFCSFSQRGPSISMIITTSLTNSFIPIYFADETCVGVSDANSGNQASVSSTV